MLLKNIFKILLLLYCITSFSQVVKKNTDLHFSKKAKKVDYTNQYGEHEITFFDKKGRLIKRFSNSTDGVDIAWTGDTLYSTIEYNYDKNKVLNQKYFYKDTLQQIIEYTYNRNKLVLERIIKSDSVYKQTVFCYNKNKLQSEQEIYDDKVYVTEFYYDDKLNLTETRKLFDNRVCNLKKEYRTKEYYIIENYDSRFYNDKIKFGERTVYYYNDDGNVIAKIYNSDDGGNGCDTLSYKNGVLNDSKYYSNGKLIFEHFYDAHGKIIKEKRYDGNIDTDYKNIYNDRGDLIQIDFFEYGRRWTKTYEYEYWD